jgi:uroporphyrin-III C-methyltransferase
MGEEGKSGILVVGHGSRRHEANDDIREVARKIAERGDFGLVEAAFLELEQPDVAAGFKRLVERGACKVTVHPYFLSPGRHTRGDLPREVGDAAAGFPGVRYHITEPLSAHPLVIEASLDRIREAMRFQDETEKGIVYLVGAGPGAPELLTVRARDLIATCDLVVYDYLVDPDVLRLAPSRAERIYAGKVGGGRSTSQTDINRLLVRCAREGKRIVRLKGGDPFLFGRGGEEAEALEAAGIRFEIVPGVSSALAVPAYAGIPLTQRGTASSVAIVTGANAVDGSAALQDLSKVSQADTIVVLMGTAHLREITEHLVACGRDLNTPVAVIRWGSYEAQQTVVGTLHSITQKTSTARMRSPTVIVVGEVVHLREHLQWFEKKLEQSDRRHEWVLQP